MFRFSCFVHVAPKSSVLESGSSTTKMVEKLFGERKKNIYKQKTKKKKEKIEEKSKERKMRKRRRVEFHICSMLSPRLFSPFSFSSSSSSSSKKKKKYYRPSTLLSRSFFTLVHFLNYSRIYN